MNSLFPEIKTYAAGPAGIDWENGKFRFYSVDMADAGPGVGSWVISGVTQSTLGSATSTTFGSYEYTFTTSAAHGLDANDQVAVFGRPGTITTYNENTTFLPGQYVKNKGAGNESPYRWYVVRGGMSGNNEPAWQTLTSVLYVVNGACIFVQEGSKSIHPINRNYTVFAVPSSTTFTVRTPLNLPGSTAGGYIANLSKTYLADFAPPYARTAMSDALTGKTILAGGVLDASDTTLDLTVADSSEAIVLAKAADLHADPDVSDGAQPLIAHYDALAGLPIAQNAGVVAISINNGADRLLRL